MKQNNKYLEVLSPSWLSMVAASFVSLAVIVVVIIVTRGNNSAILDGFFAAQSASATSYRDITTTLARNPIINNAPLFIFWLTIGLVVYTSAVKIYEIVGKTGELREEMDYVNVDRKSLVRAAVTEGVVRLVAAIAWLIYLTFFFKVIVPYVLTATRAAALFSGVTDVALLVLVFVVSVLSLFVNVVFLRLILARTKVFQA